MAYTKDDIKADKSRARASKPKVERFNDFRFVNYELDKEQKAACKAHAVTADELLDQCLAALSDGYKISLRSDEYSGGYACFMQPNSATCPNQGLILTGRGSSPLKALKQLFYKHLVCLDREWESWAETRTDFEFDD